MLWCPETAAATVVLEPFGSRGRSVIKSGFPIDLGLAQLR